MHHNPSWLSSLCSSARYYCKASHEPIKDSGFSLFYPKSLFGLSVLVILQLFLVNDISANETDTASTGVLLLSDTHETQVALLLDTEISINVQGMLADMTLTQRFRNVSDNWLEGNYLFPLPDKAAVRGMQIKVGDRIIRGKILTRQDAKTSYAEAKQAGKIASVVDQQRPNLFTVQIANIAPNTEIRIELDVMLPVSADVNQLGLVLPTTFTPRYTNTSTPDAKVLAESMVRATNAQSPRFSLQARFDRIDDLKLVTSPSHNLAYRGEGVLIDNALMDRDLQLQWPANIGSSADSRVFVNEHGGRRYVQLMMSPPDSGTKVPNMLRELVLVIDKSGSMAGQSIDAAREAMETALDGLKPNDQFNIIAFDDQHYTLFAKSRHATTSNLKKAKRFIHRIDADGGTEMMPALRQALSDNFDDRLRQIVFITDGSVGYEEDMLVYIQKHLASTRLFTIGIGSAPNRWFLDKAASIGGGMSLSIADSSHVESEMTRLLDALAHPVITNLRVTFPNGDSEIYPSRIPDLYSGEPLMIVAEISENIDRVEVSGQLAGERWRKTLLLPHVPRQLSPSTPSLAMHWARQKVASLVNEQRISGGHGLHRDAITLLALEFGLVTQYTSFVAVENQPVRAETAQLTSTSVASLMPAGTDMQTVPMPQGAAGIDSLLLLALLLAVLGGSGLIQAHRLNLLNGSQ
ncbi:MAG: marine proteobacterial sortase target protein [Granulosicoccus sp.]